MAELACAVVGAVDVCIRSAHEIKEICRRFRAHDKEIEEKTVLVDAIWFRIESQMRFLSRISKLLEEELIKSQLSLLHILEGKLRQAITQLALENSGNDINDRSPKQKIMDYLKKWKWAIKDSLRVLVVELEAWQTRFDPTWYLTILNSDKIMDLELRQANRELANELDIPLDLPKNQLNPLTNMWKLRSASKPDYRVSLYFEWAKLKNSKNIPVMFSTARAILREKCGQTKLYIAEAVTSPDGSYGPLDIGQIRAAVESLAGKLQQIDPDTFGLLSCKGLINDREPATKAVKGIELLYDTPQNSAVPASLRGLLLDRSLVASLSSIVRIAKHLIRSVSFVHTSGFVHKNIRPENILVFPSKDSSLGMSFLVGFNQFRRSNQPTNLLGDPAWHRNLYRHPERQGTNVMNRYVMQHDIYSLGVCLLEIGLWQSFVHYPGLNPTAAPVTPMSSEIQINNADFEAAHLSSRLRIKEQLVDLAKRKLPSRVGDVYTEVVLACLLCLDPRNGRFGDINQEDKDGILVGIRFIEQILARINGISI
ncbi:uncharacterized protein BDZ99DRAFT_573708 [Mytilinidion resinicola]|uniref:Protein kinase domain-containing protein n=1 Tax=Mytilinidion resinicola TaxID=574789 RepID=A0A6A6YG66_9PEZI|nr:uncharacterized protein BDZ99DRAFT_573708 [Mytilinidion resinicola]KAF2807035.1 hypothetical protein BDZ99DRAFT_573708 [Mytilinidion resinicola]